MSSEKRIKQNKMSSHLKTEGDINLSSERKKWTEQNISELTQKLLQRDANVFLHQSLSTPCLNAVDSCNGIFITDTDGRQYMDFHGNNVHQLGYNNSFILERTIEAMRKLHFSPRRYTNQYAVEFAEHLTATMPAGLNRVLFAPGGTLAIGMALKLARYVTGKHKVISTWDSFHGASLDAISAGGEALFQQNMGPLMPGVIHVPAYNTTNGFFNGPDADIEYARYIEYVAEKETGVGAIIMETIRNTTVHVPSKRFWQKIREICDRHGILLILDEIPIAMGRTGKLYAFENMGIEPDILVLGKGLGGGVFPMAAIVTRDEYNVASETALGHYTHEKSPVGSAAGIAVLEYIRQQEILQHVNNLHNFAANRLEQMKARTNLIGEIRSIGLLWGIELAYDGDLTRKNVSAAEKAMYTCMSNGLSFKVSDGNILTLSPPLTITGQQLMKAFDIVEDSLC